MKAYKDLEKTEECGDGDLVAVLELDDGMDFVQQPSEKRPVFIDGILDAEYISDY